MDCAIGGDFGSFLPQLLIYMSLHLELIADQIVLWRSLGLFLCHLEQDNLNGVLNMNPRIFAGDKDDFGIGIGKGVGLNNKKLVNVKDSS